MTSREHREENIMGLKMGEVSLVILLRIGSDAMSFGMYREDIVNTPRNPPPRPSSELRGKPQPPVRAREALRHSNSLFCLVCSRGMA
jgi:hypothetical protein